MNAKPLLLAINLLKHTAKNYQKHFLNVSWRTCKGGAEMKGLAAIRAAPAGLSRETACTGASGAAKEAA